MKRKIRSTVYELSCNSRITTRELGKKLKLSQQSASYLLAGLRKKGMLLSPTVIIDPARLGYTNLLVYYNFTDFSSIQEITAYLKNNEHVASLERLEHGYDLACIYCIPNLSFFNKIHREFLQSFRGKVLAAEILPVVVRHVYPKNYLIPRKQLTEFVICGDRDVVDLSEKEKSILKALYHNPAGRVVELAVQCAANPKTVIALKQKLEKSRVIRGYSALWDYSRLAIQRRRLLLNAELSLEDDRRFLEYVKIHPFIIGVTRLLGRYHFLVEIEGENLGERDVLKELRAEFPITGYRVLEGGQPLKEKYIPEEAFT